MAYHFSKPSAILSQYVKQYWAIDVCVPINDVHVQRIVPSGLMELMFYLGDRPKSLNDKKNILENTVLSGQQKSYYDIEVTGKLSLFSISFFPYGAKLLFGIPSSEFFDLNYPLKYLLKDVVEKIEAKLFETNSFEEKVCLVESFLINLLRKNSKPFERDRIVKSIELINQSAGLIDIETLSSFACLSRKQYERIFNQFIGSSPKQFLRTVRFQNTLYKKKKNKNMCLTE